MRGRAGHWLLSKLSQKPTEDDSIPSTISGRASNPGTLICRPLIGLDAVEREGCKFICNFCIGAEPRDEVSRRDQSNAICLGIEFSDNGNRLSTAGLKVGSNRKHWAGECHGERIWQV